MQSPSPDNATQVLAALGRGDRDAAARLLPIVYDELRALAGSYFRGQPAAHTLEPTALVHEAFVKLVDQTQVDWKDRGHFFAVAATAMRQILCDHARRARAQKRGGEFDRVSLDAVVTPASRAEVDLVALDDALAALQTLDPRKYRIVELRFFGGLEIDEVARLLDVSGSTVKNEWRAARAWLMAQLGGDARP